MFFKKEVGTIVAYDKSQFLIRDIVECGQLFRFEYLDSSTCKIISKNKICILKDAPDCVTINCDDTDYFTDYFDLSVDYNHIKGILKDADTDKALEFGKGIRMLKQDPVETLFSFIVSQNNNIPRIKSIIAGLSESLGEKISDTDYAFPSVESLASRDENFYKSLGLGYRAEYIVDTARRVLDGFDLDLSRLSSDEARRRLMTLKGVGPKVADCILLFGYSRMDVFPVDTWGEKIYRDLIAGDASSSAKMALALRDRFGDLAGYAQQYLFYYYRNNF